MDAGVFILIFMERRIDFSFGSQPVCHRITTLEAAMFSMEIGGNGNMLMMLGCLVIEPIVLCCLVIDGSLFM